MGRGIVLFRLVLASAIGIWFVGASSQLANATTLPPGFSESIVYSGLSQPTSVVFSPDGRVFVAEKSGIIKVFPSLTVNTPTVFADLRTNVYNAYDRGLLGLALHPNFPAVPYIYVLYTYDSDPLYPGQVPFWGTAGVSGDPCPDPPGIDTGGCAVLGRLSRLTVAAGSNEMVPGSELVLVQGWGQMNDTHSVGTVLFGPDGALYASGGEGANWLYVDYGQGGIPLNHLGDPPVGVGEAQTPPTAEGGALRSQSLRRVAGPALLSGTIIRVDPSSGAGMPDNPLASSSDPNARRIVAYGLRNPFRFTIRPGTNQLWIGDVGWEIWEEINVVRNPLSSSVTNFGWPCYEGLLIQPGYQAAGLNICQNLYNDGSAAEPYYVYNHGSTVVPGDPCPAGGSSISGLAFNIPGNNYPAAYQGALFFADASRSCIWTMFPLPNGDPNGANVITFGAGAPYPAELKIGPGGDLFYVSIWTGTVRRIQYTAGNQPPKAVIQASPLSGPAPLQVNFDGSTSFDPDAGNTLTYSWDLNGDGIFGDAVTAQTAKQYTQVGTYNVQLRVTDNHGASNTASVVITVGNSAPTAFIDSPVVGTLWQVGQQITFSGHATDPNEGTLPPSAFYWEVVLHHCPSNCHTHPGITLSGATTGSLPGPDHSYYSYLEIRLTVTDSGGLTDTKTVSIDPQTLNLNFASNPSGLQLVVGANSLTTPFTQTFILGATTSVSAPTPQAMGSTNYSFASWSDGGNQSHQITASVPATFTSTYNVATTPAPTAAPASSSSGGGGCTLGPPDSGDALLPALFLVVFGLLLLGKRRRPHEADRTVG